MHHPLESRLELPSRFQPKGRWARIAHRGNPLAAPGNSRQAVEAALRWPIDAVEADLRRSADGQWVLAHDPELSNAFGNRLRIAEHSFSELAAFFAPQGELMTLSDLTDLLRGQAGLLLDLKEPGQAEGAARSLLELDFTEAVLCGGIGDDLYRASGLALATTLGPFWSGRPALEELPSTAVSVYWQHLTSSWMQEAAFFGLQVLAWTVDEVGSLRALGNLGVQGIISNRLDYLCA
jgi:glycerophosphoryl diester phosphodiesterase